jgi:hypothetical protein
MNVLLSHALADAANMRFVFVSGHCIPTKPFAHVYDALMNHDVSHFSAMDMLSGNDQGLRRTLHASAGGLLQPNDSAKGAHGLLEPTRASWASHAQGGRSHTPPHSRIDQPRSGASSTGATRRCVRTPSRAT